MDAEVAANENLIDLSCHKGCIYIYAGPNFALWSKGKSFFKHEGLFLLQ